ncbi:MAG: hypothetical protein RR712_03910 [Terrisporobacter sp.]
MKKELISKTIALGVAIMTSITPMIGSIYANEITPTVDKKVK